MVQKDALLRRANIKKKKKNLLTITIFLKRKFYHSRIWYMASKIYTAKIWLQQGASVAELVALPPTVLKVRGSNHGTY